MKEASEKGMISKVDEYIDSSDYTEIFSRFATMDIQKIEGADPRIEGIQKCYQNENCAGVETLAELFKNRRFKDAINHKLWINIGDSVKTYGNVAKKYQKIHEMI